VPLKWHIIYFWEKLPERRIDGTMRCSNCGKRIKKKSSYCMNCRAKVPRIPKSDKKKAGKKKRSFIRTAVSIVAVFLIVFASFVVFGDDIVPEKVRNQKAYSNVAAMVRDRVPDRIELPFGLAVELPIDMPELAVKLPFGLDERLAGLIERFSGLTGRLSGLPFLGFLGDDDSKDKGKDGDADKDNKAILAAEVAAHGTGISGQEAKTAKQKGDKNETEGVDPAETGDGEESKTAVSRSEEEIKLISAGADNSVVLNNYNVFEDIPADWIRSSVRILEHRIDVEEGTDTVVIYLELENSYINLAGTKEITYRYNERTGNWEPDSATKISCVYAEPVTADL